VLAAITSSTLPEEVRTTGLAFLDGAVAVAGFVSALMFGALWSWLGSSDAVITFLVGLTATLSVASFLLLSTRNRVPVA